MSCGPVEGSAMPTDLEPKIHPPAESGYAFRRPAGLPLGLRNTSAAAPDPRARHLGERQTGWQQRQNEGAQAHDQQGEDLVGAPIRDGHDDTAEACDAERDLSERLEGAYWLSGVG